MKFWLALFPALLFLAPANDGGELTEDLLEEFHWRSVGPANMGGRITDIAVVESKPQHFFIAAATGGVWKTVNHGTTWKPIFDSYGSSSIGDIAVCQSDPDVLWVGTGEANARNSVIAGDGIYKSTDGGKSFRHKGLRKSFHIGRIRIHPKDPDTVYVAALGNVWLPNPERGLYKTTDGGETWKPVLQIDENHGCIDVVLDPKNPDTLYAAIYAVRRDAYSGSGSPSVHSKKAGIYKSTDGGESWARLSKGLPGNGIGRVGLSIFQKDPRVLYAIVETEKTRWGRRGSGAYMGISAEEQEDDGVVITRVFEDTPAYRAGFQEGDVILKFGKTDIRTYRNLIEEIRKRKPEDKVTVKIRRDNEEKTIEFKLGKRPEEDEEDHAIALRSQDSEVEQGGVFRSDNGGESWTQVSTLNPRAFYFSQIRVDPTNDQRVYVLGVRLHASRNGGRDWSNAARRGVHVDHHSMWIDPNDPDHILLGNDGGLYATWDRCRTWEHFRNLALGQFYSVGLDTGRPYRIYGGLQDNGSWGGPSRTRRGAITNADWAILFGMDGFTCRADPEEPNIVYVEGQYGRISRLDLKTGGRDGIRPRARRARFEWHTPLELSPHEPKRIYTAAQWVFRSDDRGSSWDRISPNLTKTERGSVSALGPSPVDEKVLWAGTNDGAIWVTRDQENWTEVSPPKSQGLWVTGVEPSRTDAGTAFASLEGRRKGKSAPFVWKTEDFGKSWTPLHDGLPDDEPVFVIRQDPVNPDVLYAGTVRSAYVSANGGGRWVRLGRGLPVVPVFDLQIHPRAGEIVAGTHGRSVWVLDVRALQQIDGGVLASEVHLFEPEEGVLWNDAPSSGGFGAGHKAFRGDSGPSGTVIAYYLKDPADEVALEILNSGGRRVARLKAEAGAGIHRIEWSLRRRSRRRRVRVEPGTYTVRLTADGTVREAPLKVVPDPANRPSRAGLREY